MINKMQKEYLEKRLNSIVNSKMNEWDEKHPEPADIKNRDAVFYLLNNKKIKLKKRINSYDSWYDIRTYFDFDEYCKKYCKREEWQKERNKFYDELKDKAVCIMDKVIFEGLDLQDALKEIETLNV